MAAASDEEPLTIPHSFDTELLLEFASGLLKRRRVRGSEFYFDLIERTGIVAGLSLAWENAKGLFERGLHDAEDPVDRARFLFLTALYGHFRGGEFPQACRLLRETVTLTEGSRRLRTRALLLLGRAERQMGDFDAAEAAYDRVLHSGVLSYRPLAMNYLSNLRMHQGRHEEAIELNRESRAALEPTGETCALRQVEADLGSIHLDKGDYRLARRILEAVIAQDMALLDISGAGRAYNNLAVACVKMGDLQSAQRAYAQALRFHAAAGRNHLLSGTYRNLGICLGAQRQTEAALAAFERAIDLAQAIASSDLELKARTEALAALGKQRDRSALIPLYVARCNEILETSSERVTRTALQDFARTLGGIAADETPRRHPPGRRGKPRRLATPEGHEALDEITGQVVEDEFGKMLSSRLQPGLSGKLGPSVEQVAGFLMLYAGEYFRFGDYAREFALATSRAKPQLRELCERRIIELTGIRKAAKYSLAFHRV